VTNPIARELGAEFIHIHAEVDESAENKLKLWTECIADLPLIPNPHRKK